MNTLTRPRVQLRPTAKRTRTAESRLFDKLRARVQLHMRELNVPPIEPGVRELVGYALQTIPRDTLTALCLNAHDVLNILASQE